MGESAKNDIISI